MVSFKLFAGTNIGLRENNEDNFAVCPDLTKNEWIVPADCRQMILLGEKGCVMVVADGMGGENAGEVASAIAVDTVQTMFSPHNMPADVLKKPDTVKSYLRKVITEADIRIKQKTKHDPTTSGMGSTIVIAWVVNKKLYIAWLGDSRAYSFVAGKGIARLSKDHSYVQQLVDNGTITQEEAMDHPNSNIITRSLGDTSQKAKADVSEYDITNGEIILLCSDGLCGVCQDEEIGGIIESKSGNLAECKESLTVAALGAGGSDNITISLLQLFCEEEQTDKLGFNNNVNTDAKNKHIFDILVFVVGVCILLALAYIGYSLMLPKEMKEQETSLDTVSVTHIKPDCIADTSKTKVSSYKKISDIMQMVNGKISVKLSSDKISGDECDTIIITGEKQDFVRYEYDKNLLKIDNDGKIKLTETAKKISQPQNTDIKVVGRNNTISVKIEIKPQPNKSNGMSPSKTTQSN